MATLSQLLALPDLSLRLVQAGPGDPELSWVSTTELLELGGYLEGGEIVLTTGLALEAEDPRWRDFVAGLNRARVAAIGFGIGVNHERIPAPLLAAASTYRVALVEVPPPVPFIAVSKAVAGLLHADELRGAQRALQIHQRLLEGARGPQTAAEVLAGIAQATGRQLALLAADHSVIARTAGFAEASGGSPGDEVVPLDEAAGTRLVIAGGGALGPEERAVVAAGAMVLGLELRGERSSDERERGRWAVLAEGLLRGEFGAEGLTLLDPDLPAPDRVRAIAVQGAAEDLARWRRGPRSGFDRLVTAAEPRTPGVALAWQLCPDDGASDETAGDAVERALSAAAGHGLDAVVGRAAPLADAALSRRSAAARLGELSSIAQLYEAPRAPTAIRADRGSPLLDALLGGQEGGAPEPGQLARAVLGPLSAHPSGNAQGRNARGSGARASGARGDSGRAAVREDEHGALRETLRTLLEHHGQRGPAAAELGIHRNTLRGRLQRIEALTGRSLDLPDDRAELWLALRLEGA